MEESVIPSEQERIICAHVRQKVEECRAAANRTAHESIWMRNIAYTLGFAGVSFNASTRQFQPINRASQSLSRNTIRVNKILPTLQNRMARLCKNPPRYDVRPESNSTEDKDAARLSQNVLAWLWDLLGINEKRLSLVMYIQTCGHAYVKVLWDTEAGEYMMDPLDQGQVGYQGDVGVDVVSPFEVFPDPLARTFDDVKKSWLIQCRVRPLEYFKNRYGERGAQVQEEETWLLSSQFEQRVNSINARGPAQGGAPPPTKNTAIEMIKYEARSEKNLQGRMIVVANGVLLEDKPLPCGEIPFAKFDDIVIGGKYYSESIVTHLVPIQDYYNEIIRRRAEWTRKFLAGKYIAAKGCGLSQESMNDESGEIVLYTPVPNAPDGGRPVYLQVPALPQWAYAEEDKVIQMFNDISGISEVSRGTIPSASIPAIGMQLLVEQDDTRIGVITEQHEHAWAHVGGLILKYVERYWTMPRKLKLASKAQQYNIKEVKGEDLKGNTDVIVIRGSTLPGSKSLKRQEILNAYQMGLLGDPNDPKVKQKVMADLEFGDTDGMWDQYAIDMAQIKEGMEKIKQGIPVPAHELDNHILWIQELNDVRKSEKFAAMDPMVQQLFEETLESHIQLSAQLAGAPPPPGPVTPEEVQQEQMNQGIGPNGEDLMNPQAMQAGDPNAAVPPPAPQPPQG